MLALGQACGAREALHSSAADAHVAQRRCRGITPRRNSVLASRRRWPSSLEWLSKAELLLAHFMDLLRFEVIKQNRGSSGEGLSRFRAACNAGHIVDGDLLVEV